MTDLIAKTQTALSDIRTASEASLAVLPDHESILPPANGITLLDTKNEIFLSYLQTLALRNLEVVREARKLLTQNRQSGGKSTVDRSTRDGIVADLVRHRVYLDKGIRPLEDRLKYQVDKVLKAVDDHERQKANTGGASKAKVRNGSVNRDNNDDDDDDSDSASENAGNEADELSYRPNPAAFSKARTHGDQEDESQRKRSSTGAYRPPRINATTMPMTAPRDRKAEPKQSRNATMDEYINDELSSMPVAQPSVGSTILAGGRRSKTAKERQDEDDRREYEETNLMRLPKDSKKERGIKRREAEAQLGGEDLRGLGGTADRIGRLTKNRDRGSGALAKSRKRKETTDGPRGDGHQAGGAFEQRRKKVMRRLR